MASYVYLKNKKTGKTYVYENISIWNKETKKCDCKRRCVGFLDPETNEIIFNKKNKKENEVKVLTIGDTIIFDYIVQQLKLDVILKDILNDKYNLFISCVYYLLSKQKELSYCSSYLQGYKTPFNKVATNKQINELLSNIDKNKQNIFFERWNKLYLEKAFTILDINPISLHNEYTHYETNQDLDQMNLCIMFGEKQKLPMYYQMLPDEVKDIDTLTKIIKTLKIGTIENMILIMDKEFYSEKNINGLYEINAKYLIDMSLANDKLKDWIDEVSGFIINENNKINIHQDNIFVKTLVNKDYEKLTYVHIYYNNDKAIDEHKQFDDYLEQLNNEITTNNQIIEHKDDYDKYFKIENKKLVYNVQAINQYKKTSGYFILMSNCIVDSQIALEIYYNKDNIEKRYDNLKNNIDCKNFNIHLTKKLSARLFMQFISLIIASKIQQVINESKYKNKYTFNKIINEMKTLHEIRLDDKQKPLFSQINQNHKEILEIFNINIDHYD